MVTCTICKLCTFIHYLCFYSCCVFIQQVQNSAAVAVDDFKYRDVPSLLDIRTEPTPTRQLMAQKVFNQVCCEPVCRLPLGY